MSATDSKDVYAGMPGWLQKFFMLVAVIGLPLLVLSWCSDDEPTKKADAARPGIGKMAPVTRVMPGFAAKEDLERMIQLAARDGAAATAFLLERMDEGKAVMLEVGDVVKVVRLDGWLEPLYQVRQQDDVQLWWVHCRAFEK